MMERGSSLAIFASGTCAGLGCKDSGTRNASERRNAGVGGKKGS
jgi:hypothetical protein